MNYVRRFVFVHYEDLLQIRFRKLEKVSDKLFVFMPEDVADVPLWLVKQMQNMGSDLDWIDLGSTKHEASTAIMGFHMGVMHEKVDLGVEFAVLSESDLIDPLVAHIHDNGRTCVRVRQGAPAEAEASTYEDELPVHLTHKAEGPELVHKHPAATRGHHPLADLDLEDLDLLEPEAEEETPSISKAQTRNNGQAAAHKDAASRSIRRTSKLRTPLRQPNLSSAANGEEDVVPPLADDLVRKLIRSGNRPGDLSLLRSYVLLHSDEADAVRNVDAVIEHLRDRGEIHIEDDSVEYNF